VYSGFEKVKGFRFKSEYMISNILGSLENVSLSVYSEKKFLSTYVDIIDYFKISNNSRVQFMYDFIEKSFFKYKPSLLVISEPYEFAAKYSPDCDSKAEFTPFGKSVFLCYNTYHPNALLGIRNAIIGNDGYAYVDKVTVALQGDCKYNEAPEAPLVYESSDIVFTISQYWGNNVYHFLIEDFPRIIFFLDVIKQNENIKVHVNPSSLAEQLFQYFGIPKQRLISGNVYANFALIPTPSVACGNPSALHIRFLNERIVSTIEKSYSLNETKKYILLIKRSNSRRIDNYDQLLNALNSAYPGYIFEFLDNPTPSLAESFHIFYNAEIIVAPHGAGLSNIIACSKKLKGIIEYLTNDRDINICYMALAKILGFDYYGFIPSPSSSYHGTITADIPKTLALVDCFMNKK
jgi:hypothetical protein